MLRYRAWGRLDRLLPSFAGERWRLFHVLGWEDRATAAFEVLSGAGALNGSFLCRIAPPQEARRSLFEANRVPRQNIVAARMRQLAGQDLHPEDIHFDVGIGELRALSKRVAHGAGGKIIFDISSCPKRFFFPLLKDLLRDSTVTDLLATYAVPTGYADGVLAEDFRGWDALPMFGGSVPSEPDEALFVGVGYMPMGLPESLNGNRSNLKIRLILPFPPGPPSYKRTWQFAHEISSVVGPGADLEIVRIDARDVGEVFDTLCSRTAGGTMKTALAPFGPKPHSLAMCLFAIETGSRVFYTQPTAYNAEYSVGIARDNGVPLVYGYVLKRNGVRLYRTP